MTISYKTWNSPVAYPSREYYEWSIKLIHFVLICLILDVNIRFGYELCDEVKKMMIAVDVSRIFEHHTYCKVSNIWHLVGNRIVDHSAVWYKTKFGSQNFGYQNW